MILGDKLYRLRKSKKLSQEQLALELQVSKTAIIKWEQNKAKPSVENILKICDFYETDFYSLLEDVSNITINNSHLKGQNYAGYFQNFTVNNNNSPELITQIQENQSKINGLFEQQSMLFESLLKQLQK
ncbi:helix-turn-helix transcriptional regulator [uncultured Flavobacterium sp.]|uniref:helix-turn-helix domain-containing protein n=1 Tax=uncultured Flavobacterium sp. TaxID=165435 RepID=UPI0030EDC782